MSLNWAIYDFLLRFDGCDLDVTFELLGIFFVVVICNAGTVQYVDIQILLLISYFPGVSFFVCPTVNLLTVSNLLPDLVMGVRWVLSPHASLFKLFIISERLLILLSFTK